MIRIIGSCTVIGLVCVALIWRGLEYYHELQVAEQLTSLGAHVTWEHLHVRYVSLPERLSGLQLASMCAALERLSALKSLSFGDDSSLTDSDLQHLSNLTTVEWLYLSHLRIDGSGLSKLQKLQSLTYLNLTGTNVNDGTVGNVNVFKKLNTIRLDKTQVGTKGIAQLVGLGSLSTLDVSRTKIDDRVTPIVAQIRTLRSLRLSGTQITDGAVEHLAQLKGLCDLWIDRTRITEKGIRLLKKALPNTSIIGGEQQERGGIRGTKSERQPGIEPGTQVVKRTAIVGAALHYPTSRTDAGTAIQPVLVTS
jgi:hypothetical protein